MVVLVETQNKDSCPILDRIRRFLCCPDLSWYYCSWVYVLRVPFVSMGCSLRSVPVQSDCALQRKLVQ